VKRMSGRDFLRRVSGISFLVSIATIVIVSLYLFSLLQLPPRQWLGFAQIVAVLFVLLFGVVTAINLHLIAPIRRFLDAEISGDSSPPLLRDAYAALARLPLAMCGSGVVWWTLGGLMVATAMKLRFASFQAFPFAVMVGAAATGGLVTTIFMYFILKRALRETLRDLARRIGDPELRSSLSPSLALRHKLLVSITGVTTVTLLFGMFLGVVRSSKPLEARVTEIQARYLAEVAPALDQRFGTLDELALVTQRLGIAEALLLVDVERAEVVAGPRDQLYPEELRALTGAAASGDSRAFDSPHVFAWRTLDARGLRLVAISSWAAVGGGVTVSSIVLFCAVMLCSAAVAYALSRVVSEDVGSRTEQLRAAAERLSAGDLRESAFFESEDELGALARSFERMQTRLRDTLGRVGHAADAVESGASEIARLSGGLHEGAGVQGRGVERAAGSMERIGGQVAGIAGSAEELNGLAEETSSQVLELGATGSDLDETAGMLFSRVGDVSRSLGSMVESVKAVGANTRALSAAAGETSSSMEQMASAMRHVDATASETARLSRRVVEVSEGGRARVQETIDDMESIRRASDAADLVIRGLGERAVAIGSILDVIDDVADETNLLALNAAIIAAQAGEPGRAFSIVADEIKALAERVRASTKEIGALINAVQEESRGAIEAVEDGGRSVARGVARSLEAGASLEEITRASRESESRIESIVHSVQEQTKAASYVAEMMERVRSGVDAIEEAAASQEEGNEIVFRSSLSMGEVSEQLRRTTSEQARGTTRIRESAEGVREAVESIHRALQAHATSFADLKDFLSEVSAQAEANERATERMGEGTSSLARQAESLRQEVRRFRL